MVEGKKARPFILEKNLETTTEKGLNDRKIWETLQRPPKEDPELNNYPGFLSVYPGIKMKHCRTETLPL